MPTIAGADTSGGNALNVQRTVKELIAAGAAGCFLEHGQRSVGMCVANRLYLQKSMLPK